MSRGKEATEDGFEETRILALRERCDNATGYGIYRMLTEILDTSASGIERGRSPAVAYRLRVSLPSLEQVIQAGLELGLFEETAGHVYSMRGKARREAKEREFLNRRSGWERRKESMTLDEVSKSQMSLDEVSQSQTLVSPLTLPSSHTPVRETPKQVALIEDPNPLPQRQVSTLHTARAREARTEYAPRISMSETEFMGLVSEFGEESVKYHLANCSDWLISNGKTKKNYAAFLRNWIRKEIAEQRGFYNLRNPRFAASSPATRPNTAYSQKLAVEERALARARAMDAGEMASPFPEPVRRR